GLSAAAVLLASRPIQRLRSSLRGGGKSRSRRQRLPNGGPVVSLPTPARAPKSFRDPRPAVLLAVPFSFLPLTLARPLFDILVGWAFTFGLWKLRGPNGLLALTSGAYLFAMASSQTTPLMVAAILMPALGFLLAVRPNISAAL